jgi:hypothetical protein
MKVGRGVFQEAPSETENRPKMRHEEKPRKKSVQFPRIELLERMFKTAGEGGSSKCLWPTLITRSPRIAF